MGKAGDVEEDEGIDLAWRVELLRALVTGDLPNVKRVVLAHIEVISAPFTATMSSWMLQWEGMYWWMLQDATPLFVASAYSRPDIVHWLLINGADRSSPCYLKQIPAQVVVGECCAHAALPDRNRDTKAVVADSATCLRLLTQPPMPPLPPTIDVTFSSSYSSEVVITRPGSFKTSSIQQTVYKCLLRVSWYTPLSNGAVIDKYELRYRRLRVTHNRKSRHQNGLVEGLQFNSFYEFMLRSWNAAGNSEWSPSFQTKTPEVPTRSVGA
ncbi:Putative plasma membrane protein [Phytophthora palmivora]|uniref:Plasma membrane protein n=1 Tax=Phytophthora palmivora TaxID=4796 RepID=A0A2P4XD35_9STRA|nr:Putative plasma membrane protein [Phytophthora palmivora]